MRLKTSLVLVLVALVLLLPVVPAAAGDAVGITTTVDAQLVSISADYATVDFGTMADNSTAWSPQITITNNGTTPVRLAPVILSVSGPGGATWAVRHDGVAPGTDECSMKLTDMTTSSSLWLWLNQMVWWPSDPTIAVGATRPFGLEFHTGTTTTYGTFTIPVGVFAYAP